VPSIKVEEVLLRHPAVLNAAAVGLPHERWGEAITAFVTLEPGAQATPEEIVAHCKAHLGGFEVPKDAALSLCQRAAYTGQLGVGINRPRSGRTTRWWSRRNPASA